MGHQVPHATRHHGFEAVTALNILGMETRAGQPIRYVAVRKRIRKVKKRLPRFRRLRGFMKVAKKVAAPSLGPAMYYGLQVVSAPPPIVDTMTSIHRVGWSKTPPATSTWLACQLEATPHHQPDCFAVVEPIYTWAQMVMANIVPRKVLESAWRLQSTILSVASQQWKHIAGPAGAVFMCLRRLNWRPHSFSEWTTGTGIQLDLKVDPPAWVRRVARRAYTNIKWEEWSRKSENAPETRPAVRDPRGYWIEPVRMMLHSSQDASKWRLDPRAAGALRFTVIGGQWSQARLANHGYAADSDCLVCPGCLGTLGHRFWRCTNQADVRQEVVDSETLAMAAVASDTDLLFTRALLPRAELPVPPPPALLERWYYYRWRPDTIITGTVFTDGSGKMCAAWPEANRAGWGLVIMNRHVLVAMAHGPLPGFQQTAPRAEMLAVLQAVQFGVQPLCIKTDCLPIVEGLMRGKAWSLHVRRENLDLWHRLWHAIEDQGGLSESLKIEYVQAHQVEASLDQIGNDWADIAAKKGLAIHAIPDAFMSNHAELLLKIRQVAAWTGNMHANQDSHEPDRQQTLNRKTRSRTQEAAARARRVKRREAPHPDVARGARPHAPVMFQGGWKCAHCPRQARTWAGRQRLKREPCLVQPCGALPVFSGCPRPLFGTGSPGRPFSQKVVAPSACRRPRCW